jgi:ribonucleoside-diphosphate reductase alpha chain
MDMQITKRNGQVVSFDPGRISNVLQKAFRATQKEVKPDVIEEILHAVMQEVQERFTDFYPNVENIQDLVEKHLMQRGHFDTAKAFILYRAKRQKERDQTKKETIEKSMLGKLRVHKRDGRTVLFELKKVKDTIGRVCKGFEGEVSADVIAKEVVKNIYDEVSTDEIEKALILATISFIERDPSYNFVGAQLFLQKLYKEVTRGSVTHDGMGLWYREQFKKSIKEGVDARMLDARMLEFDLDKLSYGLNLERDNLLQYIGIQTLYERYFIAVEGRRLELPQGFWMRVSMGLAMNEENKNEKALEFYNLISSLRFVPSTPTLFHAGLTHPQLSSCYLTTINDDLSHIFKCIGDNAQLSKWSGGVANDWTSIRATGAWIKSTNVESQGVIPFLKIANDTTVAINRSGKRRGATCAYLETWHLDIEDFLDLRRNTGDDRRRAHDMNTSNWIPDLFMKRVLQNESWTLFTPNEVPELHELYGKAFEKKYKEYEEKARNGQLRKHKVVSADKLWKKMLSRLFETGHPWITFKDPSNIRSPQDHAGVVHSSNLCTEITLNTSSEETAVCNLGSVNLEKHTREGKVDEELIAKTVKTAMRMLDNVIDLNFYPTIEAKNANMKHRPVGLGIMGFQDALFKLDVAFDSPAAVKVSDRIMELISYHAILSSSLLAQERGTYQSYKGSKWDRGIFPVDTLGLLEEERNMKIDVSREESLDWALVRASVKQHGIRNSNCMAIAPTATISNIAGCFPCIEPIYKNIYVKANMSGEFTIVNAYLVRDLKKLNLWNQEMLEQLKYYDGNVQFISGIPQHLKDKYKEAFEVDPEWLLEVSAARGKWIDQSQSHNVFMKGVSGKKLHDIYFTAWKKGLKTTYYLRTMAASQIEKSTLDASKYGYTQKREYKNEVDQQLEKSQSEVRVQPTPQTPQERAAAQATAIASKIMPNMEAPAPNLCRIEDPDCEACQ